MVAQGLSVRQAMMVIVISRALISLFSSLIAWCGCTWHIGYTVQNRQWTSLYVSSLTDLNMKASAGACVAVTFRWQ